MNVTFGHYTLLEKKKGKEFGQNFIVQSDIVHELNPH